MPIYDIPLGRVIKATQGLNIHWNVKLKDGTTYEWTVTVKGIVGKKPPEELAERIMTQIERVKPWPNSN